MDQGVTLSNILKSFTLQPDQMWYLVWEGYGSELSETLAERPHRRYLAYRGEIGDSREFYGWGRGPADYWFPQDQEWCVAGDVDIYWTYVGGTQRCIEAILSCTDLETVPVDLGQGLTVDSDLRNRLSPEEQSRWH